MEETLEGGRGPARAVVPLEGEEEEEEKKKKKKKKKKFVPNIALYVRWCRKTL